MCEERRQLMTDLAAAGGLARKLLMTLETSGDDGLYSSPELVQLPEFLARVVGGGAQPALDGLLAVLRGLIRRDEAASSGSPASCSLPAITDPPPHKLLRLLLVPELDPPGDAAWQPPDRSLAAALLADCVARHEQRTTGNSNGGGGGAPASGGNNHRRSSPSSAAAKGLWLRFEAVTVAVEILRSGGVSGREAMLLQEELRAALARWSVPRRLASSAIASGSAGVSIATARVLAAQLRVVAFLCLPGNNNNNNSSSSSSSKHGYFVSFHQAQHRRDAAALVAALEIAPSVLLAARSLPPYAREAPSLHEEMRRPFLLLPPPRRRPRGDEPTTTTTTTISDDDDEKREKETVSSKDPAYRELFCHCHIWASVRQQAPLSVSSSSSSSSSSTVDMRLLSALTSVALDLAASASEASSTSSGSGTAAAWRAGHWVVLQQRIWEAVTGDADEDRQISSSINSSISRTRKSGGPSSWQRNNLVVKSADVPALVRLCIRIATTAAAAPPSPWLKSSALSATRKRRASDSSSSTAPSEGELPKVEDDRSMETEAVDGGTACEVWIQMIIRLVRGSMSHCDVRASSAAVPSMLSSSSSSSLSSSSEVLLGGCDAHAASTLDLLLEQLLPSAPLVTRELQRHVERSLLRHAAPSVDACDVIMDHHHQQQQQYRGDTTTASLPLSWHDAALVLLLLRSTAPLAATLASLHHSGSSSTGNFRESSTYPSASTSPSPSHAVTVPLCNANFCLDDSALALLPTELDTSRHLSTLLLAVLLNAPSSFAQTAPVVVMDTKNGSNIRTIEGEVESAATGAAEVLWRVLTLDGAESLSGAGFWDSGDDLVAQMNRNTSPRKAVLASQLVSIALSWVVAPIMRLDLQQSDYRSNPANVPANKVLHHISPGLAATRVALSHQQQNDSKDDLVASRVAAKGAAAVAQSVLAMVFREAPEARATIIDALAGGALAVSGLFVCSRLEAVTLL
jgi:hypothetical protein